MRDLARFSLFEQFERTNERGGRGDDDCRRQNRARATDDNRTTAAGCWFRAYVGDDVTGRGFFSSFGGKRARTIDGRSDRIETREKRPSDLRRDHHRPGEQSNTIQS